MIGARNLVKFLISGRGAIWLAATAALFWLAANTYFSSFDPRSRCETQFRQDWDPAAAAELDTNIPLSRHCNSNFDVVPPWINIVLIAAIAVLAVSLVVLIARRARQSGGRSAAH